MTFSQPYACEGEGLYCLFVFPEGSEFVAPGAGGGAAIGYATEGGHEGWLCADEETWTKVEGVSGLAIEPILIPATPGMVLMNLQAPVSLVSQAPQLQGAHPNPFNPMTVLEYTLPEAQQVELAIYDVGGRLVRRLESGMRSAGPHRRHFARRRRTGPSAIERILFRPDSWQGPSIRPSASVLVK